MFQLYFFTVEFGLCKQEGEMRVYGAGLLSSVAELRHAIESVDKVKRFDPTQTCKQTCIITAFQEAYWYTDSFEEAKEKMRYDNSENDVMLLYDFIHYFGCPPSNAYFTYIECLAKLLEKVLYEQEFKKSRDKIF